MSKKNLKKISDNEAIHFLHDLLNHTHGLKLFLESKENEIAAMGKESLALIYQEIQALENQIASQFDKLTIQDKSFSLKELTSFLQQQFQLYDLDFKINACDNLEAQTQELNLNLFERMIKNIVKNIFLWSDKESVHVTISEVNGHIELLFKNAVAPELDTEKSSHHVGLLSLKALAKKQSIEYKSWAKDGSWITLIRIKILGYSSGKIAS